MRVLFLCHRFSDTQIGGLAEFLHYLPLALHPLGIESVIYTQHEQDTTIVSEPFSLSNGVTCYRGPFIKPSFFTSSKKLNPFLNLCIDEQIDVIHAQGVYRSGYMAMKAFQKINLPYVVTSHSDILSSSSERMKRNKVQNRCIQILKHAKAITHLTPTMADAAHDIFDTRNKSTVIGNGIDINTWQTYTDTQEKNYLLAIGRLVREKGFDILVDAFAKLKHPQTSLIIAGSGIEEKNLQTQAQQLGLNVVTDFNDDENIPANSVIFTGYISGERKMRLISAAKIILFAPQPSIWEEPFGIVQLEAMAAGKPLIASNTVASRYLQKSGLQTLLVEPESSHAWASAISRLLEDDKLQTNMSKTNLHHAHQFDWKIIAGKYANTYKKTLEQNR